MDTCDIIRKWYGILEFPEKYDRAFNEALSLITVPEDTEIENYDLDGTDGAVNLLSFLYMCERTEELYWEKGIGREILTDTLKDIKVLADTFYRTGKRFYLGDLWWLKRHLTLKIFKLGRLQFSFGSALCSSEKYGLAAGDPVIEVHIDETAPLTPSECDASFEMAGQFFKEFFPEYDYRAYTCESWLMDDGIRGMLPKDSNILKFQDRFDVISKKPSDSILQYVFKLDTVRENVAGEVPINGFAGAVKTDCINGRVFYEGYGVIARS